MGRGPGLRRKERSAPGRGPVIRRLLRGSEWRREVLRTNLWLLPAIGVAVAVLLFAARVKLEEAAKRLAKLMLRFYGRLLLRGLNIAVRAIIPARTRRRG